MTVSGIVSHLRWVEWSWIHVRLLGEDDPGPWTDDENDPDREIHFRLDWPLADVVADYQELARSHDELFASSSWTRSLRSGREAARRSRSAGSSTT